MSSGNVTLDKFRFQRMLEKLEQLEGRGTELVTVYIPPGRAVSDVMNDLREEYGTAANIKSKSTRKNVQDALTKAMEKLKLFNEIPETGLAIFAGNVSVDQPGGGDMETYVIVPPEPINIYYYRCEHRFMLDPLFELMKTEATYGVLVMDAKEATLASLRGQRANIIEDMTSGVPGKTRAGGQSARRYERLRNMHLNEYYHRIGDHMTEVFLNMDNLKGIIVGGPGPTKEDFLKGNYLHYELKDKILTTVDTGYTGAEGVKEVVERSKDFLRDVRYMEEREVVQDFLKEIGEESGLATYGEKEVLRVLNSVNVRTLLISEGIRRAILTLRCSNCGYEETRIIDIADLENFQNRVSDLQCLQCQNTSYEIVEKEDFIEHLVKKAEEADADIEIISTETEEGNMLYNAFGGVAAITKYRTY
jgi:peptide chain release factor subunit 1